MIFKIIKPRILDFFLMYEKLFSNNNSHQYLKIILQQFHKF